MSDLAVLLVSGIKERVRPEISHTYYTTFRCCLEAAKIATTRASSGDAVAVGQSILLSIKSASSLPEALGIASEHVMGKLGRMFMIAEDQFDLDSKSIAD